MGRIEEDKKNKATDACRVPPGLSHQSWFAATVSRLKKQDGTPDTSGIDLHIFVTFWIILLLFVPLWNIPYSLGANIQITQGEEVDWNSGFEIDAMPYVGLNETLLLNATPDDSSSIWDTGSYYANTKTSSNADGYTISTSGAITNPGFFSCLTTTSVSIPDIEELYFGLLIHGIEGSCNVTLSVTFTVQSIDIWADLFERSTTGILNKGETLNLSLSTPVALLKTISPCWLSKVSMSVIIRGTPSATLTVKETVIKCISDKPLYPVTIDATATTGESLHSSYLTRYLSNFPVMVLNRTGGYGSPAIRLPSANYTVFLPQGQYSSAVGWFSYSSDVSSVIDSQILPFEITPDEMLHLRLKMRAFRLDINNNVPLPFYAIDVYGVGNYYHILRTPSEYSPWPDHFYLPPTEGVIEVHIRFNEWSLQASTELIDGQNQRISFSSPLTVNIFGLLMNLGQIIDFGLVVLMILLVVKRWFVKTAQNNRRAVIFDYRFLPLILLLSSFLFPWIQYSQWGDYLTSYFSALPVRVLTIQDGITFTVISFGEWIILGLLSLLMLWIPLVGLLSQLLTPESKSSSRKTTKLLLLPFLYGAFFLIGSLLSGYPVCIGPILAMLGLPVWLSQRAFRHKIRPTDVHPSSGKKEGDT